MKKNETLSATFNQVATVINSDGVICYPTEGVWGLGCHPESQSAFQRLLMMKKRSLEKGVILLAGDIAQLEPYIVIDEEVIELFQSYKGKFVTFVLPHSAGCPQYLTGGRESIAVRLTQYQPLKELCRAVGTALVSTSANISGEPTVQNIRSAEGIFQDNIDYYVDFALGGKTKPSQILKFNDGHIEVIRD